ncbi:MAG: hypothetical protein ACFCGT_06230 [Sandaracinaceae bacterium]
MIVDTLRRRWPAWARPSAVVRAHAAVRSGGVVAAGPFAGMRFGTQAVWGASVPKLIGCYEREVHEAVEELIAARPRRVVVIGAAEGYYAVGLARRLPDAAVLAFDTMDVARRLTAAHARDNGVGDRVEVRGTCDVEGLAHALEDGSGAAVVCDVEGYEQVLIDPERVPALAAAHLLVEVHDGRVPGVSGELEGRFGRTHRVTPLGQERRSPGEYPWGRVLRRAWPAGIVRYGLNEFRSPETSWLWMVPRAVGSRPRSRP